MQVCLIEKDIHDLFKKARKEYNKLIQTFKDKVKECIELEGEDNAFWIKNDTTDDCFSMPTQVELNGCWLFDTWVNSNVIPENKKHLIRESRYPVKSVAFWYAPSTHMKFRMSPIEFYNKCEKEKILYKENKYKISIIRRNVIPFTYIHYSYRLSPEEFVLYIKDNNEYLEILSASSLNKLEKLSVYYLQ